MNDLFTWFDGEVPENLEVRQVYGLVFTKDGRMLLKIDEGIYSFGGGTPESYDKDRIDTLKREMLEEVNTTLLEPIELVGYQLVNEGNDVKPYAQIRMTAVIDTIGEAKPDPDGGKIYKRVLVSPNRAIELLNWGQSGFNQVTAAVKIAKEKLGITSYLEKEEYV